MLKVVKKFKTGDYVEVIAGDSKGKRGTVKAVFPKTGQLVVEGANMVKKHLKPTKKSPAAQVVEVEKPLDSSNVAHIDAKTGIKTRIGFQFVEGKKMRCFKRTGELLEIS